MLANAAASAEPSGRDVDIDDLLDDPELEVRVVCACAVRWR
jgi:hypothetical protein